MGYETLIYDCMVGDATLFQRADKVEAGWSAVQGAARCLGTHSPPTISPTTPPAAPDPPPPIACSPAMGVHGCRSGPSITTRGTARGLGVVIVSPERGQSG